jgi:hypothetical protein
MDYMDTLKLLDHVQFLDLDTDLWFQLQSLVRHGHARARASWTLLDFVEEMLYFPSQQNIVQLPKHSDADNVRTDRAND